MILASHDRIKAKPQSYGLEALAGRDDNSGPRAIVRHQSHNGVLYGGLAILSFHLPRRKGLVIGGSLLGVHHRPTSS